MPARRPSAPWLVALLLLLLAVGSVADVLLAPGAVVASSREADTFHYFARVRSFAAEEILAGNLPLWNPHVFAGQPFLGSIQPALFYPPLLPYLVLPLDWALNLEMVLHVFLMGLFTFLWARGRGVSLPAAGYAGAAMMLCGSVSLRVFAGQLTVLTAAAWMPLALFAVERLLARPTLGATLLGVFAFTMQLLAGYPLYAYVTGIVLVLTVPFEFVRRPESLRAIPALAVVAALPPLLAAVQLLPAFEVAGESLRAEGVPEWFATSFSLPPANLLTALAPAVFGDSPRTEYWGHWRYWDVGMFLGVVTVLLAGVGALRGDRRARRFALPLALLMLALALGRHTPLYGLALRVVPGFDGFRAPSKFTLQASLFVALLAGAGLDRLLRGADAARLGALLAAALAVALGGAALGVHLLGPGEAWAELVRRLGNPSHPPEAAEIPGLAVRASAALALAAGTSALAALLFALRLRTPRASAALALLGVAELFVFAATHHDSFALSELERPELERFYREHPGDYRVLDAEGRNHAMSAGALAVWGYDPFQLARYARFSASLQAQRVLDPEYELPIAPILERYHPRLGLVRCAYVVEDWSLTRPPRPVDGALPRASLYGKAWLVEPDGVLPALFLNSFDPRELAIVEEDLEPRPSPEGAQGTARVVEESTDHLVVEADAPAPALLVVTDAYSRGWRAFAEGEGSRRELRVLPVDGFLRGVMLPEGRHRVRFEYAPWGFRVGAQVSAASLVAITAASLVWRRRRASARIGPHPRQDGAPAARS